MGGTGTLLVWTLPIAWTACVMRPAGEAGRSSLAALCRATPPFFVVNGVDHAVDLGILVGNQPKLERVACPAFADLRAPGARELPPELPPRVPIFPEDSRQEGGPKSNMSPAVDALFLWFTPSTKPSTVGRGEGMVNPPFLWLTPLTKALTFPAAAGWKGDDFRCPPRPCIHCAQSWGAVERPPFFMVAPCNPPATRRPQS